MVRQFVIAMMKVYYDASIFASSCIYYLMFTLLLHSLILDIKSYIHGKRMPSQELVLKNTNYCYLHYSYYLCSLTIWQDVHLTKNLVISYTKTRSKSDKLQVDISTVVIYRGFSLQFNAF
jgi:hypothetical protein